MKKTICVLIPYEVEIFTEPRPCRVNGLQPEFACSYSGVQGSWARTFESFVNHHGFLDAPEYMPAGYCAKYESGGLNRVHDVAVLRG